eukprot:8958030-Pyramimonas_sp.AAC.1
MAGGVRRPAVGNEGTGAQWEGRVLCPTCGDNGSVMTAAEREMPGNKGRMHEVRDQSQSLKRNVPHPPPTNR